MNKGVFEGAGAVLRPPVRGVGDDGFRHLDQFRPLGGEEFLPVIKGDQIIGQADTSAKA